MNYVKKSFLTSDCFRNDFVLSGTFIASQKEHRTWTKDGVTREMDVLCIFIQNDSGVYVCRSFNPPYDFSDYKSGESINLPVSEYKIEGGVKSVAFRLA